MGRGNASGCRSGKGHGDPLLPEALDRGIDRGFDADEQRGLYEQLGDVTRALSVVRGELGVVEVDEVRPVVCVDDNVLEREVAMGDPRPIERPDLPPQPVEELSVDPGAVDVGQALARHEVGDQQRGVVARGDRVRRDRVWRRRHPPARRSASASCSMRRCTVA